jgi:hypothetical protein
MLTWISRAMAWFKLSFSLSLTLVMGSKETAILHLLVGIKIAIKILYTNANSKQSIFNFFPSAAF